MYLAVKKAVPELTVLVLELVSEVSAAKKVGKQGIACCVMQCTVGLKNNTSSSGIIFLINTTG